MRTWRCAGVNVMVGNEHTDHAHVMGQMCSVISMGMRCDAHVLHHTMYSDIFYKDVPDGVHALCFGILPNIASPLALVGGNCSIQGFNSVCMMSCSSHVVLRGIECMTM